MERLREDLLEFVGMGPPVISKASGLKNDQTEHFSVKPKHFKRAASMVGVVSPKHPTIISRAEFPPDVMFNEIANYELMPFDGNNTPWSFPTEALEQENSNGRNSEIGDDRQQLFDGGDNDGSR